MEKKFCDICEESEIKKFVGVSPFIRVTVEYDSSYRSISYNKYELCTDCASSILKKFNIKPKIVSYIPSIKID